MNRMGEDARDTLLALLENVIAAQFEAQAAQDDAARGLPARRE